jgi:hypothetical protein
MIGGTLARTGSIGAGMGAAAGSKVGAGSARGAADPMRVPGFSSDPWVLDDSARRVAVAEDFPLVRKPMIRALDATENWWERLFTTTKTKPRDT